LGDDDEFILMPVENHSYATTWSLLSHQVNSDDSVFERNPAPARDRKAGVGRLLL